MGKNGESGTDDANNSTDAKGGDDQSPEGLLRALNTERRLREMAQEKLKQLSESERSYQQQLDKFKDIDPVKYAELLARQAKIEEDDLAKAQEWEKLKKVYGDREKNLATERDTLQQQLDNLHLRSFVQNAYRKAGGFDDMEQPDDAEQIDPFEMVYGHLGGRIKLEKGQPVIYDAMGKPEVNAEGKPKQLYEKMLELKRGAFGLFFQEQTKSGSAAGTETVDSSGNKLIVYSREQARKGQADMAKVASGEAVIR